MGSLDGVNLVSAAPVLSEMMKLTAIILVVLLGTVAAARAQQRSGETLSDADKTRIIEAVLDQELLDRHSPPDFDNIDYVSSENIDFIEPSRILKHGFTLVAANALCDLQAHELMHYILFTKIAATDNGVAVGVSHVTAGRACFNSHFYSEQRYHYEARRNSGGWQVQLTRKPAPSFFAGQKLTKTRRTGVH